MARVEDCVDFLAAESRNGDDSLSLAIKIKYFLQNFRSTVFFRFLYSTRLLKLFFNFSDGLKKLNNYGVWYSKPMRSSNNLEGDVLFEMIHKI